MKLWLVLVVFGHVAAAWGPLPGDRVECEAFVDQMVARIIDGLPDRPEVRLFGHTVTETDIDAYCVFAARRPARGSIFLQNTAG